MGGRPPGARRRRRREARVERPSARRDTRAVKGGSGSRTATPTGLNWDFGGRRGRVWRGCAGAARERLSSPSVTSEDVLPLVLPYPPVEGRVAFSPLGREDSWWTPRRSVLLPGLLLTPHRLRGSSCSRNVVTPVQTTPQPGRGGEPPTPLFTWDLPLYFISREPLDQDPLNDC